MQYAHHLQHPRKHSGTGRAPWPEREVLLDAISYTPFPVLAHGAYGYNEMQHARS